MTTAEVLRGAAQVLREQGWCQRTFSDKDGRCCLEGAIAYASLGSSDAAFVARDALRRRIIIHRLHAWNDRPGRTAEEVIALLESTAAELEAQS